jgi:ADP-ribose pyrophosphatase YjhB (NUDIX family)
MYRIFHGKHRIILTTIDAQKAKKNADFIFKKPSEKEIKQVLLFAKKSTKPLKIVFRGDPQRLLKEVFSEFIYVTAAGGIVENKKGEVLLMKRSGKWDLPKGKTKKNEPIEVCALREIEEETGAKEMKIVRSLNDTFHTYYRNKKWVLKHTFWYMVYCKNGKELAPQIEEDIEKVKWFKPEDISIKSMETYPAIAFLLKKYLKALKEPS